jgi:polyketide synthase PksN
MRGFSTRVLGQGSGATAAHDDAVPLALSEHQEQREVVVPEMDRESLREKTQGYLRREFSGLLKLPSHKIDPEAPLEQYGIDSIMAMKLTNQLEETFGSLAKTLFFEYQTIAALAEYFVQAYPGRLAAIFAAPGLEHGSSTSPGRLAETSASRSRVRSGRRFSRQNDPAVSKGRAKVVDTDAIAIIGLSGRYPEAVNVEAYWKNLRAGKDCIIEVPKERWDWREYYSEDRSGAVSSQE